MERMAETLGLDPGIGVALCVEGVGLGPFEGAILRLDGRGHVVVTSGAVQSLSFGSDSRTCSLNIARNRR